MLDEALLNFAVCVALFTHLREVTGSMGMHTSERSIQHLMTRHLNAATCTVQQQVHMVSEPQSAFKPLPNLSDGGISPGCAWLWPLA